MNKQSRKRINSLKSFKFTSLTQTLIPINRNYQHQHFHESISSRFPQVKKRSQSKSSPIKILPTIQQHRQTKKNNSKELSTSISKFYHFNQISEMKFSEQLIKSAVNVLKGFSQVQNNFQQLFTYLHMVLKRFIFVQHQIDLLNKYSMMQGVSFRKLALSIDALSQNILNQKTQSLNKISQKYQKIRIQVFEKENVFKQQKEFLMKQVQKYKKLANIEYVKSLQRKIQVLKQQISEKIQEYTNLARQNEIAYEQISTHKNHIQNLKANIIDLKQQIYKLHTGKQNHEKYLNLMKDRFDDLQAKMTGLKQLIIKVQMQNEQLITQRVKLVNRAAVGFEGLTPRPKYSEILGQKLEIGDKKLNSTQKIVEKMLIQCQKNIDKSKLSKDILYRQKTNKLMDAQIIRAKVSKQIQKSKNQLKQFVN